MLCVLLFILYLLTDMLFLERVLKMFSSVRVIKRFPGDRICSLVMFRLQKECAIRYAASAPLDMKLSVSQKIFENHAFIGYTISHAGIHAHDAGFVLKASIVSGRFKKQCAEECIWQF